jgi:hypothetical protein
LAPATDFFVTPPDTVMSAPSASRITGRDKITGRIVAAPRQASGIASMRTQRGTRAATLTRIFRDHVRGGKNNGLQGLWSGPLPALALPRLAWKSEGFCHDGKRQRTTKHERSQLRSGAYAAAHRAQHFFQAAHPRERPFSQELGARLDLQARSPTMRRWTVAEEAGMP